MKKNFFIILLMGIMCFGLSGCALFIPIEETDGYTHTTTYYSIYRPAPSHHHHHYHHGHGRGHKHRPRPTAHPHKPHTTHKPTGGHVGGHKPTGGGHKPTGRPSSGSRTGGSRTGGSRTSSGSRR